MIVFLWFRLWALRLCDRDHWFLLHWLARLVSWFLLRNGLLRLGWKIASPEPLASGILAATHPTLEPRAVAKALEERGVIVAPREGFVRFSPHAGNDLGQVERVLEAIGELR